MPLGVRAALGGGAEAPDVRGRLALQGEACGLPFPRCAVRRGAMVAGAKQRAGATHGRQALHFGEGWAGTYQQYGVLGVLGRAQCSGKQVFLVAESQPRDVLCVLLVCTRPPARRKPLEWCIAYHTGPDHTARRHTADGECKREW